MSISLVSAERGRSAPVQPWHSTVPPGPLLGAQGCCGGRILHPPQLQVSCCPPQGAKGAKKSHVSSRISAVGPNGERKSPSDPATGKPQELCWLLPAAFSFFSSFFFFFAPKHVEGRDVAACLSLCRHPPQGWELRMAPGCPPWGLEWPRWGRGGSRVWVLGGWVQRGGPRGGERGRGVEAGKVAGTRSRSWN